MPISKIILLLIIVQLNFISTFVAAFQQNKTSHLVRRSSVDDSFFKKHKQGSYRSYQPVSIKYHKTSYPRADDKADYDITSYDTEYGGVVSNFTSSIYDDNPPLYPNPEDFPKNGPVNKMETEIELPDDSLADADLKEHNIIDSVTYLYGFNNCPVRNDWFILIFIASAIVMFMVFLAIIWLMWSEYAAEFRRNSKLYPININLCCCLMTCTLIYVLAIVGVSSPSHCEKIALLLHYSHICSAMWIVTLAAAVAEYCACETLLPLKYNYLLAYGVPAIVVMFNYALSMEHYEIKHYCWMSIEKGMVMGFMVPATVLILINTGLIIVGLQSLNKEQADLLQEKLQDLYDYHVAKLTEEDQNKESNRNASVDTLENIDIAGSSRKNTESSETLDKDYNINEDECHYVNVGMNEVNNEVTNEPKKERIEACVLKMLYMDNITLKLTYENNERNELKTYLHLCLILEPFFAINWVMGVVALENATHWSTPTIYLILLLTMYMYFIGTVCTTLPIIRTKNATPPPPPCDDIIVVPTLTRTRTTDSIPLLDPTVQQPNVSPAPADSISTISI